jgi:lipopolysaccharide export system protein LptC
VIDARNRLLFAALTAGALASWYLARQGGPDDAGEAIEAAQQGYYLRSARILGTGNSGSLLYEIVAASAEQQLDGRIAFTDVAVHYSPDSDVPWRVSADTATIDEDASRVFLRGYVRAVSSEGFSGSDTEIRTQYLVLEPENYLAETDQRVQIRIGARSLTATGMLASLKDNTLELKSNVSGKFVP